MEQELDASASPEAREFSEAQQARMSLSSANSSVAQAQKLEKKAGETTDAKKQEELRAKAKTSYESAIKSYRQAIEHDPRLVEAYVGLAEMMLLSGRIDLSIQTLEKALEIDPESLKALAARGRAQLETYKVEDAKATYDRIAAKSAKAAKSFLADMRSWLERQRAKLGPEMQQAVEDLDRWIREHESK
jgi:tetratricopeptide (TPR) repeat protein